MLLAKCNLITKVLLQQILISYRVEGAGAINLNRGLISSGWLCNDKCKEVQRWANTGFRPNVGIGSMFGLVIYFFFRKYGGGGGTKRPYRNKPHVWDYFFAYQANFPSPLVQWFCVVPSCHDFRKTDKAQEDNLTLIWINSPRR